MVGGHLLDESAIAHVFEDDKVTEQVEQVAPVKHALEQHLELGQVGGGQRLALDRTPGSEALAVGRQRADAGLDTVGDDQGGIVGKQRGDLRLVGLELLKGVPDGGVLVGGVLELDHGQGQAVDEDHHVRPAVVVVLDHRELVDRQPVVVSGVDRSR